MQHSADYVSGFRDAVESLGREGDRRHVDWSAAYSFLTEELHKLAPAAALNSNKGRQS
jgi:hypothetical protein